MSLRFRRAWLVLASVALACVTGVVVLQGQGAKPSVDASMTQLIDEVRQLRLSVERSSLITARVQALLGRVQLQESRLGDLGRRLDGIRERLRSASFQETMAASELATRVADLKRLAPGSEDLPNVEAMVKASRERLRALQAETAELRASEQEISGAIAGEQGRWQDYNSRLETLERELVDVGRRREQP